MKTKTAQPRFKGIFQLRTVRQRIVSLVRTPFFWVITLWGNAWIFGGAIVFHYFERGENTSVQTFLDSLTWAVGTVTTVGASNLYPVTTVGKVLNICMMMGGALFLWSYMALFVGAFVDPELRLIEREVADLQHELSDAQAKADLP